MANDPSAAVAEAFGNLNRRTFTIVESTEWSSKRFGGLRVRLRSNRDLPPKRIREPRFHGFIIADVARVDDRTLEMLIIEDARPGDAEILAAFDRYVAACKALEGASEPDGGPLEREMIEASRALKRSGIPTTAAGAAAQLRHVMQFQMTGREWFAPTLYASPAERAAFYRAHWNELTTGAEVDGDEAYIAAAIIALEAMGGGI